MKRQALTCGLVIAAVVLASGCQKLKSRDQLNKGVAAFKNAQYPEAVEHFKTAVDLDPNFASARLYLATAYMQQWIPGADSPENRQMAQAARKGFLDVLDQNPKDKTAMAYLASLSLNQQKWDESREWYQKLISVDPKNKEAYYSLGFIAWSEWYPAYGKARAAAGMKQEDPGPIKDKKVKEELKARWNPVIEAGLQALDKSLEIDPDYDDAMAYENLLIRERADLMETKEEYNKQVKIAEDWVQRNMETRKKKAEQKAKSTPGGIVAEPAK